MPDGDSLDWKVRGKGSRRVLGLVRSGAEFGVVADESMGMFVKQMNAGHWKPAMREMADMLGIALKQISPVGDFAKCAEVFDSFHRRIERFSGNDEGLRILGRGALNAFTCIESSSAPLTSDTIQETLLSNCVCALLDRRVLQPTREEVARESRRDSSEQLCYERELCSRLGEEAKRLRSAVFGDQNERPVRTPRRSIPKKETTIERLSEGLPVAVLEEM